MNLLYCGDIVGRPGRRAVEQHLPRLREDLDLDFVVANGENSAAGFGITAKICNQLHDAGVGVITTGNHAFDQKEALVFAERHDRFMRPINYPAGTPVHGAGSFATRNGAQVVVINVMGRLYLDALDDPFAVSERELASPPLGNNADALVIDFHAEATSEKMAMAYHVEGRSKPALGSGLQHSRLVCGPANQSE